MINKITIYKQLPFKNKFPLKQKEQFDQKHFCDHLPLIPPFLFLRGTQIEMFIS